MKACCDDENDDNNNRSDAGNMHLHQWHDEKVASAFCLICQLGCFTLLNPAFGSTTCHTSFGKNAQHATYLYHEVLDVPMEDGVCVVATLRQDEEVLAGARRQVTMQLQVEIPQVGV